MRIFGALCILTLLLVLPDLVMAQGSGLESQTLRGYTHMFLAYAIAWLFIVGWVVSIARRLGRIEKALND